MNKQKNKIIAPKINNTPCAVEEISEQVKRLNTYYEEMDEKIKELEMRLQQYEQGQQTDTIKQENGKESTNAGVSADSNSDLNNKKRNKFSLISDIIFYTTLVALMVFAAIFARRMNDNQTVSGFRFSEILTTSMNSVYPRGSLILVKNVDSNDLSIGEDIMFMKDQHTSVTHRIIDIHEDYGDSGKRGFVTKGVDNAAPDADVVLADNVVGRVVIGLPRIGTMLGWIKANLWFVIFLFVSLMALSFFLKIFWREKKKLK